MFVGQRIRLRPMVSSNDDSALRLRIESLDGRPIGRLDVDAIDPRHGSAEILLSVDEPGADAEDYGADALATACRYLFDHLALHRVELSALADDGQAIVAYERLGFRREGVLRGRRWSEGRLWDEVQLSLLAGELRGEYETATT